MQTGGATLREFQLCGIQMKLYNLKAGMNPRRVRIFLAEKGVKIPLVELDMEKSENKTDEFLAKNPLGALPVLEMDDGAIITESMAICRYIEELHPSPPLFGSTSLERAQIEMWNRRMEFEFVVNTSNLFRHSHPFWIGRMEQVPAYGEWCRKRLIERMAWLDRELTSRPYIYGTRYTVADITAQCAFVVAKACKLPITEATPNLAEWFARVTSRPTAQA
jgi:glutathione S-transferase